MSRLTSITLYITLFLRVIYFTLKLLYIYYKLRISIYLKILWNRVRIRIHLASYRLPKSLRGELYKMYCDKVNQYRLPGVIKLIRMLSRVRSGL